MGLINGMDHWMDDPAMTEATDIVIIGIMELSGSDRLFKGEWRHGPQIETTDSRAEYMEVRPTVNIEIDTIRVL